MCKWFQQTDNTTHIYIKNFFIWMKNWGQNCFVIIYIYIYYVCDNVQK